MPSFLREHSWPVAVSVLLHGLLAAALLLATLSRQPLPTIQPLPIDAVVVDSQILHAAQRAQADRAAQELARAQAAEAKAAAEAAQAQAQAETPPPPAAPPEAAPQSDTDATAAAQAKAAQAQENDRAAAAEQQKAEQREASREAQRREAADKAAAAEAAEDAERAADVKKVQQAKAVEDARRAADAKLAAKQAADQKRSADEKQAADAKRAADDRTKQEREAELRRQLADEEHVAAVESGPLRDRYVTLLRNKIQAAWIKPPSARSGVDCMVQVTQVPGGEVTMARVTQCNGDAAVRQSIENAVYRASPLPDPPDPALFERNLLLRFRPNE